MKQRSLLTLLLVLLLASCGTGRPAFSSAPAPLPQKEQTWQLVALRGRSLDPAAAAPTLVVNPEAGTLSGFAYCNQYFYQYTLRLETSQPDGDYYALSLRPPTSDLPPIKTSCPEGKMNAESRYLLLLDKATRLRVTATTLTFYNKSKEILHFQLQ
ncbi:MAG: META domain-containing protein [Bacteroidales bacterium]|nr:META domain-containing protein [Bacteroidales bacterium]